MKTLRRWLKRCAWGFGILAVVMWVAWLLLPKPELLPPGANDVDGTRPRNPHFSFGPEIPPRRGGIAGLNVETARGGSGRRSAGGSAEFAAQQLAAEPVG